MPFKFFTVSVRDDGTVEQELNTFLGTHRVLAVDRRWVEQGSESFWTICVDYLGAAKPTSAGGAGRTKVDYKEVLPAEQFAVFAKLRDLRKQIAQTDAVPVYTVFTNEQLAEMVRGGAANRCSREANWITVRVVKSCVVPTRNGPSRWRSGLIPLWPRGRPPQGFLTRVLLQQLQGNGMRYDHGYLG